MTKRVVILNKYSNSINLLNLNRRKLSSCDNYNIQVFRNKYITNVIITHNTVYKIIRYFWVPSRHVSNSYQKPVVRGSTRNTISITCARDCDECVTGIEGNINKTTCSPVVEFSSVRTFRKKLYERREEEKSIKRESMQR